MMLFALEIRYPLHIVFRYHEMTHELLSRRTEKTLIVEDVLEKLKMMLALHLEIPIDTHDTR